MVAQSLGREGEARDDRNSGKGENRPSHPRSGMQEGQSQ